MVPRGRTLGRSHRYNERFLPPSAPIILPLTAPGSLIFAKIRGWTEFGSTYYLIAVGLSIRELSTSASHIKNFTRAYFGDNREGQLGAFLPIPI